MSPLQKQQIMPMKTHTQALAANKRIFSGKTPRTRSKLPQTKTVYLLKAGLV